MYFSQFWRLAVLNQVPAWLGSGEAPLPRCRLPTSHCVLTWQKGLRIPLETV